MSNPENPLSRFTSYSALHTLIMCDGMRTADLLEKNVQAFNETGDDPELLFDVQEIADTTNGGESGRYIVLYDGRKDANFYINSISWETILAPTGSDGESKYDQIETEGEMEIEEPFGVEFLEALVKGTRELGVDPSSVVFMLKTNFIGYKENGQQEVIDNILPFTFIMIDLTSEMKASGTLYKIILFGTMNGVSKLPQISSIGNGVSVTLRKGDTIVQSIAKLEAAVEKRYQEFKKKIVDSLADAFDNIDGNLASQRIADRYVDVKYKFIVNDEYVGSEYTVGSNESDNRFGDNNELKLKFSPQASVEDCIHQVLKTCGMLVEEGTEDTATKMSHSPKIVSSLVPPEDDATYQVNYNIKRFTTNYQPIGEVLELEPGEFIEFDYIYTGQNIDVLDFDIKMEMGLAFFQTKLGPKSATSNQSQALDKAQTNDGVLSTGETNKGLDTFGTDKFPPPVKAPLFLGMSVPPESFVDKPTVGQTNSFDQALAQQAALENIQGRLKIVGNPQLLNESLKKDVDSPPVIANSSNAGIANLYNRPGFVRVNVQFPSSKELTGVKKFWYDGYFNIFSITNHFDGGVFTQTLDMFSLSASSAVPKTLANTDVATQPSGNASRYDIPFRGATQTTANTDGGDIVIGRLKTNDGGEGAANRDPNADIFVKPFARISDLEPEIVNILDDVVDVWKELAPNTKPVITSGNDSTHKVGSLHGSWKAIDLRANNISLSLGRQIAQELAIRVGNDYDVIYENYPGFTNNHIHLEFDPNISHVTAEDERGNDE